MEEGRGARILPAADGLIVVRGRQIVWLDHNYKVSAQATLPVLPQLTPAEMAAICPVNQSMMPGAGMFMGGAGMTGMQMPGAAGSPAGMPMGQR